MDGSRPRTAARPSKIKIGPGLTHDGLGDSYYLLLMVTPGQSSVRNG